MHWMIAAPFFGETGSWIDDFAPPGPFRFTKVPAPRKPDQNWHARKTRSTPLSQWREHWRHAGACFGGDGIVTVFPQLAATVNMRRRLERRRQPVVAWCCNVGRFPTGLRRSLARAAMRGIERIIVHSRAEVALVSDFLGASPGTVQFVPLQRAPVPVLEAEDQARPFAIAMGSANRDYATLVAAARISRLPLTIIASPRAVAGLDMPDNVTLLSNLTAEQCWRLAQRARFSIVPLADIGAASGQVTVIEAMRMGRPVIATRSIGTVDYIEDERTGLLVPAGEAGLLAGQMARLWEEHALRATLADAAGRFAEAELSDEAAGLALVRILAEAAEVHRARA